MSPLEHSLQAPATTPAGACDEVPATLPQIPFPHCPSVNRSSRYMARIDAELDWLQTRLERKQFLEYQILRWEGLYNAFITTDGDSLPGAQATDFLLTIVGLRQRYKNI